jgi:cytochrome P450
VRALPAGFERHRPGSWRNPGTIIFGGAGENISARSGANQPGSEIEPAALTGGSSSPSILSRLLVHEIEDPYPTLAALREREPVVRDQAGGAWLLSRYSDLVRVWESAAHFTSDPTTAGLGPIGAAGPSIQSIDSISHVALRKLVAAVPHFRDTGRLQARLEVEAAALVDAGLEKGSFDVVADLARPLAVSATADLLGLEPTDLSRLSAGIKAVADGMDAALQPERSAPADAAREAINQWLLEVLRERRRRPRQDLATALAGASATTSGGDRRMLNTFRVLVGSTAESGARLIALGGNALISHESELARLRSDPGLIETAVEEMLRYDSVVQLERRWVSRDLVFGGTALRRGERVLLLIGAANRDPRVFSEPDRFDIARKPNPHLAFGRGVHTCLGPHVGRLLARIAIGTIVGRCRHLSISHPPRFLSNLSLRGVDSLVVSAR